MAVFLLWNVNKKPLDAFVQSLVRQHNVDVVFLVEYDLVASQLSQMLLTDGLVKRSSLPKFGVFARGNHKFRLLPCKLGKRANMWEWAAPGGQDGNIVLIHGFDRRNYDDSTRRVLFRRVREAVLRREKACGHRRTILAGDFNAHPFESAWQGPMVCLRLG